MTTPAEKLFNGMRETLAIAIYNDSARALYPHRIIKAWDAAEPAARKLCRDRAEVRMTNEGANR